MATFKPSTQDRRLVSELVGAYEAESGTVRRFMNQLSQDLTESVELQKHIHSVRSRLKDPTHLRDKLFRKMGECQDKGEAFTIDQANLLTEINDLAGIRILHLYTRQIREINEVLNTIIADQRYRLREGPFARTWDDESRDFFRELGIETQLSPNMYTSVHYVVESNSRTLVTCELQVRTLSEEVWGEVDHLINYPNPSKSVACREQLRVLARVTSSATRLVGAILVTSEHEEAVAARAASRRKLLARRKR